MARRGGALAAISFIDSGSKSPALAPAGLAWPSSKFTGILGHAPDRAARPHSSLIALRAAIDVTMPVEKVARLPSVTRL